MVCKACGNIHVPDCATLGFEAACRPRTDNDVRLKLLSGQVRGQCGWHSAHVVDAVYSAFSCTLSCLEVSPYVGESCTDDSNSV